MSVTSKPSPVILALDVGGTNIKSALFQNGTLLRELAQVPSGSQSTESEIVASLQAVLDGAGSIGGIGISIPGPFDYHRGVSLMEHKFGAIKGRSLMEFLPDVPIRFLHDANAFLLGEWNGESRIGGITLGTGIGASVMVDGKLLLNELGAPREDVSLWKKPFKGTTVEKALDLPGHGPGQSKERWKKFGELLAEIITPWCKRHDLERIVIGGQIARDFECFQIPLQELPVVRSKYGTQAALCGVAKLFKEGCEL